MVTCPWCGTSYPAFQSNCSRCGGPIPPQHEVEAAGDSPLVPPVAPRNISNNYAFRLMFDDGWSIAGLVFLLMGAIFSVLGLALTLAVVTAFVGLPFLILGLLFLAASVIILLVRYQASQKQAWVLKWGEAVLGNVTDLQENYSVMVNGRHPWEIGYQYQAGGYRYAGRVSTLNQPGGGLQTGRPVYVLYMRDNPTLSSLYPHP